ncbi:MAG: hypothetical protein MJ185_03785 [Treponema sp.]|nr:hypothetical protein [Treponema sp.]
MEFVRKIIRLLCLSLFIFCMYGCKSADVQAADDLLVIAELTPLPKSVQLKKQVLYEPIYGSMRVLEINMQNGVQTELTARIGDLKTGVEKGVIGDIAPDASFGEIIGTFKITAIANGFVVCSIENVTRKIPSNAYIRVVVGQKIKED